MVFGSTYCKLSHLPINDGDTCILIPLGFSMESSFNKFSKASINDFIYVYTFVDKVQEVVYEGNCEMLKYLDEEYLRFGKHQLYMLVRKDFYEKIINEFKVEGFNRIEIDLHCSKTMKPIFERACEIKDDFQSNIRAKLFKGEIDRDEFMRLSHSTPTPTWIKNLYQLEAFMNAMDIMPTPSIRNDQQQCGKIYDKFRLECKKNSKLKNNKQ